MDQRVWSLCYGDSEDEDDEDEELNEKKKKKKKMMMMMMMMMMMRRRIESIGYYHFEFLENFQNVSLLVQTLGRWNCSTMNGNCFDGAASLRAATTDLIRQQAF